ncbi:MAG: universal stress protein [SAR324 cluster bacterium]|nr:universal stress protein [SAR324 cluster bacterium]
MKLKKILIAVDNSELSLQTALMGVDFARVAGINQIGLVFVIETLKAISTPELGYIAMDAVQKSQVEAEAWLDSIIKKINYDKIKITKFMPEGDNWNKIIDTADEWGADMIAVGSHGRTGFSHLLLGSVAESVVRHTKIPVLVFPAKFVNKEEK